MNPGNYIPSNMFKKKTLVIQKIDRNKFKWFIIHQYSQILLYSEKIGLFKSYKISEH